MGCDRCKNGLRPKERKSPQVFFPMWEIDLAMVLTHRWQVCDCKAGRARLKTIEQSRQRLAAEVDSELPEATRRLEPEARLAHIQRALDDPGTIWK